MDSYHLLFNLQINFNTDVIKEIFDDDWLHYQEKWERSEGNFLYFMNSLDDVNKNKLLKWGLKHYK